MEKRIFIKRLTPAEVGDTGTHEKYIRLPNDFDYENNENKHIILLNKKEKIEKAIINTILNDFKNQSLKKMPI